MGSSRRAARAFACMLVACCLSWAAFAHAGSGNQGVYWAGFAYTGEASARAEAVPYSAVLLTDGGAELNARLLEVLRRRAPSHLTLIEGDLAKLDGSTSATVLAAALDRELVSVEPIGSQYKVLVELSLQALFFDFRERQVIAAYPMTLQRIDLMDHQPTPAEIEAIVRELGHGAADTDLPQVLAHTLSDARLPNAATRRLQVGTVTLADPARHKLPNAASDSLVRATLAHELTKTIAANAGIGLLPAATGEAIGGTMATRFADGRVYQLTIPDADYLVEVQVEDWRSGVISETAAMKQVLFGAFFKITVTEPHSGTVFFEQSLRKGATKVVPSTQQHVDSWSASFDTLLAGFDSFAKAATAQPGYREWLSEQKPGGRALQQHTKALQELIQSCR